jgi:hypothetical protein
VLQLGQLDLQLAFMRTRTLGKNIEDQANAAQDTALHQFFEIAFLARREVVIENHQFRALCDDSLSNFVRLASTNEQAGIGLLARAANHSQDFYARRTGQFFKLPPIAIEIGRREFEMDKNGLLARLWPFKHREYGSPLTSENSAVRGTGSA